MNALHLFALGLVTIIGLGITVTALYDLGHQEGWWQ